MDALEVEQAAKRMPKMISALDTCGKGWGDGREEVVAPPLHGRLRPNVASEHLQRDLARASTLACTQQRSERDNRKTKHIFVPGSMGRRGACVTRAGGTSATGRLRSNQGRRIWTRCVRL
eukprot:84440-Prymnesium_polylepis.2